MIAGLIYSNAILFYSNAGLVYSNAALVYSNAGLFQVIVALAKDIVGLSQLIAEPNNSNASLVFGLFRRFFYFLTIFLPFWQGTCWCGWGGVLLALLFVTVFYYRFTVLWL